MAFINTFQDYFIVGLGSHLYLFRDSDVVDIAKSYFDVPAVAKKDDEDEICEKGQIDIFAFDASKNRLAVCNNRKQLLVFDIESGKLSLKSKHFFEKQATSVKICSSTEQVLVADRAGNVTAFDLKDSEAKNALLGHVSMILDVTLSPDEKHVITCDRDEKVRVSRFPNAYNIESFCLGHKEYVRTLAWLQLDDTRCILMSGSGDGFINFWDYKVGKLLTSIDSNIYVERPSAHQARIRKLLVCQSKTSVDCCLIVIHEDSSSFVALEIVEEVESTFVCRRHKALKVDGAVIDAAFCASDSCLFILCRTSEKPLHVFSMDLANFDNIFAAKPADRLCRRFNENEEIAKALTNLPMSTTPTLVKVHYDDECVDRKRARNI